MAGRFLNPLVIEWTDEQGGYLLHERFTYETRDRVRISVLPGFVTDLASVPRWGLPVVSKGDLTAKAAVIHDALYVWRPCTREQADLIMYEAALDAGAAPWRAWVMWAAVRVGGGQYWASPDAQSRLTGLFRWEPGIVTTAPILEGWGII